jgi:PAS domain S-box-containing protein
MDPLDIIASTADAAFATDEEARIVIWNRAAERLLGKRASQVLGKPCYEVLRGRDVFGNRYCCEGCALSNMAARHEAVRSFEFDVGSASGGMLRVVLSVVMVPGPRSSQRTIIHLLKPLEREKEANELIRRILTRPPAPDLPVPAGASPTPTRPMVPLSAREIEVLRMLSDGTSTQDIADSLFISHATVRNHIQNILRKLDVHSKLEAVSMALRTRLI